MYVALFRRRVVEEDLQYAEQLQSVSIFVLVMVLIISPILIFLVHNATQTIQVTRYYSSYWFALQLNRNANGHSVKALVIFIRRSDLC